MESGISNPWATAPRKDENARRPNTQRHSPVLHRSPVADRHRYTTIMTRSMASTASVALVVNSVGDMLIIMVSLLIQRTARMNLAGVAFDALVGGLFGSPITGVFAVVAGVSRPALLVNGVP
jgi:hypothetical protein